MSHLRTAALALIAVLVPGGLIVLVPAFYRFFVELRNKRQPRAELCAPHLAATVIEDEHV